METTYKKVLTLESGSIISTYGETRMYAVRPVREQEWGTYIIVTDAGAYNGGGGYLVTARGEFRALEMIKKELEDENACIQRKMKFVEEEVESIEEVYSCHP